MTHGEAVVRDIEPVHVRRVHSVRLSSRSSAEAMNVVIVVLRISPL